VPGPGALDVPGARVESAHPNTIVRFSKTGMRPFRVSSRSMGIPRTLFT
jgi:hypothetical protein